MVAVTGVVALTAPSASVIVPRLNW